MARDIYGLSLRDIIPPSIASDPQVQAMMDALDPELRSVSFDTREALIYSRIDELPENVIDLLAWQFHVDFYEPMGLSLDVKRNLVKSSILVHCRKGTPWAVRRSLEDLGFSLIRLLEWWELGSEPHTFAAEVYPFNEGLMRLAERCIYEYKPARSHLLWIAGRLVYSEVVAAQEAAVFQSEAVLRDFYPWPGRTYDGSLRYASSVRYSGLMRYDGKHGYDGGPYPDTPKYGSEAECEIFLFGVSQLLEEMVFAKHTYGESGMAYDGSFRYGADSAVVEVPAIQTKRVVYYDGALQYTGTYYGSEVNYA
jgi:phage tail P2-like protein